MRTRPDAGPVFTHLQDDVARFRGWRQALMRAEAFTFQIRSPFDIFPLVERYVLK